MNYKGANFHGEGFWEFKAGVEWRFFEGNRLLEDNATLNGVNYFLGGDRRQSDLGEIGKIFPKLAEE